MYYNTIKITITYLAFRNENSLSRENLVVYSVFNEHLKKSSTIKFRNYGG